VIGRFVRLQFDPSGPRACVLLEDGTCVNATLVREGLAKATADAHAPSACAAAALQEAQAQARVMRRGIWST
jgi:endonuclease YncB( thermonuclease family)